MIAVWKYCKYDWGDVRESIAAGDFGKKMQFWYLLDITAGAGEMSWILM